MAIKIAYLLLALAAACSCLDGGFTLGLTSSSRNDPVPKIEPLALVRPGFNRIRAGPSFNPGPRRPAPGNLPTERFGIRVRVRHPVVPRLPDVVRYPIDLRPGGHPPGNLPSGGISHPRPGGNFPGHLSPGRYPFNPGWNQGGHDPFGPPGMNNGPFNNGPFYGNPQMLPRKGGNFGPGGPPPRHPIQRRPDFNQINYRSRNDNDNEKDLSKGTVIVTVVAVNKTDKDSVHANVTITVVPREGDNKETLKLDTIQHLKTAQSIVDEILNNHKDEEQKRKKTSSNLEDVLNKLVFPKL